MSPRCDPERGVIGKWESKRKQSCAEHASGSFSHSSPFCQSIFRARNQSIARCSPACSGGQSARFAAVELRPSLAGLTPTPIILEPPVVESGRLPTEDKSGTRFSTKRGSRPSERLG